jgi:hypothetical protein
MITNSKEVIMEGTFKALGSRATKTKNNLNE